MRFKHDIHKAIFLKQLFLSVLLMFSLNVFADECKLDLKAKAEYKKKVTSTAKYISDMLSSKDPCVQIFLNRDFLAYDKIAKTKENSIGYLMSRYIEEFGADLNK